MRAAGRQGHPIRVQGPWKLVSISSWPCWGPGYPPWLPPERVGSCGPGVSREGVLVLAAPQGRGLSEVTTLEGRVSPLVHCVRTTWTTFAP